MKRICEMEFTWLPITLFWSFGVICFTGMSLLAYVCVKLLFGGTVFIGTLDSPLVVERNNNFCKLEIPIQEPETPVIEVEPYNGVYTFTQTYKGSRIDTNYYNLLKENCKTEGGLKLVVAISVAESGMGRDLPYREANFWGYFLNNDRNFDPSREEMARVICNGIETYYMGVNNNTELARRYVGHDPSDWLFRVNWALSQM
jgi:hypothetical protein